MDSFNAPTLQNIAVIGNYLPRRCGIATFTTDLTEALVSAYPAASFRVVAMNDLPEGYDYPPRVARTIPQQERAAYSATAAWLNKEGVDLVLVQHEYGIFGGSAGEYLLDLLDAVHAPIVTTCHTVLRQPDAEQRRVLTEIARLSSRIVVMSRLGAELLQSVYGIATEKIVLIHHGIPDVPLGGMAQAKAALGLAGRDVLLTFGLLSSGKGIETVIRALPSVVAAHPQAPRRSC
jgi:glycosyltransferase involved in cell wall biosynthesis